MKKLLFGLLAVILLICGGMTAFVLTFDINDYRQMIVDRLTEALGRPVTVLKLDTKLSLIPTVKISGIRVDNQDGFMAQEPFMVVNSAEATLSLAPLLSKRVEIQNLAFDTVNLWLIQKGSRNNWDFSARNETRHARTRGSDNGQDWKFRFDSIAVRQMNVNYKKDDVTRTAELTDASLKQLKVFTVTLKWGKNTFKLTGTLDDLMELLQHKPDYLFNLEIVGADMTTKLSGSIGDTENLKDILLNVDVTGNALKQTLQHFGITAQGIPAQTFALSAVLQGDLSEAQVTKADLSLGGAKMKFSLTGTLRDLMRKPSLEAEGNIVLTDWALGQIWGLQPFSSDFVLTADPQTVELTRLSYRAGRSDLQVTGKWQKQSQRPILNIALNSEYLDVQDVFQTEASAYSAVPQPQQVKSQTDKVVDLGFLNMFDGRLSVTAPHIRVSDNVRGYLGLRGDVSVNAGVLETDQFRIDLLGGRGLVRLKARTEPAQTVSVSWVGEGFNLNNIKSVEPVITDAVIDMTADLTATGKTTAELLQNLNGNVVAEVSSGTIMNAWFNDLVEKLDIYKKRSVSFSTTDRLNKILCAGLNLTIRDGQIISDDRVALETSNIAFVMGGSVDLVTEKMDITMRPLLYQTASGRPDPILALASQTIRIAGPIGNPTPSVALDETALKGMLRAALQNPKSYQLCEQALGYRTKGQIQAEIKKSQMLPVAEKTPAAATPTSARGRFEQQLLDSLNQILPQ